MEENELFGEAHEQEENGLFGRIHQAEQLNLCGVSSSFKPEPPKPSLSRVLRTGVGHLCKNCNSTMPRSGFLMLFGKRYCDNKKCPNSKPEKNYY